MTDAPSSPLSTPRGPPFLSSLLTIFFLATFAHLLPSLRYPVHVYTPCLYSIVLLLIRLVPAAAASRTLAEVHTAMLCLHIFPVTVLRRTFRGESGWRSTPGQLHALKARIHRASTGQV